MHYALGLAGVLRDADADQPGGFTRDDLLFHVVDVVANELHLDDYELRELLSSELPLSSDDGAQQGELLVMCRSDNVGGPLDRAEADRVIALVDAAGRWGTAPDRWAHDRVLILPPWCTNGPLAVSETHPLHGVVKINVADVAVEDERFRALLTLCKSERLPISCWR